MNLNPISKGRRFFWPLGSICATCALLTSPAVGQNSGGAASDENKVTVTDYGVVDLTVQDTDLAQVLQMLSMQSRKNIVTSKSVSGTVTANLYDVTFYEALDAILQANGYGYVEQGNFVYVYTQEELAQLEKAKRKTASRIFNLEYLSARDANDFITPLLTRDVGQSSFRGDVKPGFQPDKSDGGADDYAFGPKLVVNDYAEVLDTIGTLLAELDTKPQQVLIEATILQTSLDEANAFGVDFSVLGSVNFTDLTDPLSIVNNLLGGNDPNNGFQPADNSAQGIQSTVGGTAGPAGLKIGIVSDDISIFLKVLDEVSDSTVLARPKLMALNRQRAEVLVGARVGYLSTTATETTTTQTVQFLDTGVHLVFRPFISKDGSVRLELAPSVSEARLRNVTDAQGLQVTIPDELTNEVTTNVRVQNGQTLVLGGLFKESIVNTRRQIPYLGDIPVLGAAFRGVDDTIARSEIIFLITPSILEDDKLWELGRDTLGEVDAVQVGARNGVLPFSRDAITRSYNRDAMAAYENGDTKKALYYTNSSLRINPQQPEMIQFREKINGNQEQLEEYGVMERAFRKTMGSNTGPVSDGRGTRYTPALEWSVKTPAPAAPVQSGETLVSGSPSASDGTSSGIQWNAAESENSTTASAEEWSQPLSADFSDETNWMKDASASGPTFSASSVEAWEQSNPSSVWDWTWLRYFRFTPIAPAMGTGSSEVATVPTTQWND